MSAPLITINHPSGAQSHIRRDTAEALGIRDRECIGQRMHDLAVAEDWRRNKADRRQE
jgi:hypothetical protein